MPRPAVFLDRDGVLCEDRADYVKAWDEWRWVPGAREGAAALAQAGKALVVVSNQACIGKGLVSRATVDDIHARVREGLAAAGAPLAGLYLCPHTDADRCECRKPKPGLLLQAARDLDLDLAASTFVGDALRDGDAAHAAGTRFVLVCTGQGMRSLEILKHSAEESDRPQRFHVARDLPQAARMILRWDRTGYTRPPEYGAAHREDAD